MTQISFLINCSVNTLDHLKLLIRSLRENLQGKQHEILIFVDSDNEGTTEYLRSIKKDFFDLKIITHSIKPCVGYSRNNNLLVELAKHDIVSYLQSDMVISKNYDADILKDLEDNCILSSTRIEPPLHGESNVTITTDFGLDPNHFKWKEFLQFSETVKQNKTVEHFFAPFTFYKHVWLDLGGYDTLFRRSREDSDLLQRFIHYGVKIKQTFNANVYHFSCVTSRGKNWFDTNNEEAKKRTELQKVADQIEMTRFIKKWGGFNHGEKKLHKLDMDLVIKDCDKANLSIIMQLEPFFSRVWLDSKEAIDKIKTHYGNQHEAANSLLNFKKEDWDFSKRFYNQIDFDQIYFFGDPEKFNIKVDMKIVDVDLKNDELIQNLQNIYDIFSDSEEGIYELGNSKIEIKSVLDLSDRNIKVKNTDFDYSLINIE
jgi:hypothetical protein